MHDVPAVDVHLIRRLWTYISPYRLLAALSLVLLAGVNTVQLAQPYLLKYAIDESIAVSRLDGLAYPAMLFLFVVFMEFFLRFGQLYTMEIVGQNVIYDLRCAIFSRLLTLDAEFHNKNPVGRLMTRVTSDVEALQEALTSGLVLILADLAKILGIIAILLWLDLHLAAATLAVIPPMLAVSWYFRRRMRATYRQVRKIVARLNTFLQEQVSGIRLVQAFCREREIEARFAKLNEEHRDAEERGVVFDSAFSAVAELLGTLTLAWILWVGGRRILGDGITFGTLVAFVGYAQRFFEPVQQLSQRYAVMQSAMASTERLFDLLDTHPRIVSPVNAMEPARLRGEIIFENVTFGYAADQPVLRNVSFRIAPGEKIAIVGWTGSGKSTVIRLLVRLYDVQGGRILLDGIDLRDFDLMHLRRSIGVVVQDHFLFSGTIATNVSLDHPKIDARRVTRALDAVGMSRRIAALPEGIDSAVAERGGNFSVGEKQLLSFARALAFESDVMVLDEATASIDTGSEAALQHAIETALGDRTSIIIAHRLAAIRQVDRILVFHHGMLTEQGTHSELIKIKDGLYRALHDLQTEGGRP